MLTVMCLSIPGVEKTGRSGKKSHCLLYHHHKEKARKQ